MACQIRTIPQGMRAWIFLAAAAGAAPTHELLPGQLDDTPTPSLERRLFSHDCVADQNCCQIAVGDEDACSSKFPSRHHGNTPGGHCAHYYYVVGTGFAATRYRCRTNRQSVYDTEGHYKTHEYRVVQECSKWGSSWLGWRKECEPLPYV